MHGTQSIEILKPIPAVSGPGWKLRKRIVGVSENSASHPMMARVDVTLSEVFISIESGIVVENEQTLVGPDGQVYARLFVSIVLSFLQS